MYYFVLSPHPLNTSTCIIPRTDECTQCYGVYSHMYYTKNWWVSWMLWSVVMHLQYQELMSVLNDMECSHTSTISRTDECPECYGMNSHMYDTKNWWLSWMLRRASRITFIRYAQSRKIGKPNNLKLWKQ